MQLKVDFAFPRLNRQVWMAATGVVVVVYLLDFFTPFRLTNDTVRYFALLEQRLGTWPASFGSSNDFLPYGYVFFLEGLARLHILTPFTIALCQLLYLGGSLYFIKKLFGTSINTWLFACLTLLNWTTIKLVMTPLSELQFLFFTSAALYSYHRFLHNKRPAQLVLTVVLCLIAFVTRTAGIVLIAALLLSFLVSHRQALTGGLRQRPLMSGLVLITLLAGLALLVTRPKFITYLGYFWRPLATDGGSFFAGNLRLHAMDLAELFINTPYSKVAWLIAPSVAGAVYLVTGLLFLGILIWCLIKHRTRIPLFISFYLVLYLLLIFNWPFFEARFFFPILPFMLAVYLQHLGQSSIFQRRLAAVYLTGYVLMGVFVMAYYSRLSYDRDFMKQRHDAGIWEKEYDYLFSGRAVDDGVTVNQKALYILRKYN
ncbi:hypothetical protein [Paraflavitalea pollutisoli]|uniref:hypothetical protein n=1 Tax=Paraflavitalea pollutisoli TaxID=3034143 RepID=UPI0023ED759E|nr:hypothetical protein [Paraflavitalea sp. H1-2-19X]